MGKQKVTGLAKHYATNNLKLVKTISRLNQVIEKHEGQIFILNKENLKLKKENSRLLEQLQLAMENGNLSEDDMRKIKGASELGCSFKTLGKVFGTTGLGGDYL